MKIVILCGPGEVEKRTAMLRIKESYLKDAVSTFDLSENKLSEIELSLSSQSLFDLPDRLLIIENTPDELDLKKIVRLKSTATLIFLTGSLKSGCKLLTSANEINAQVLNFEAEKETLAFPYLDNLVEGKKTAFDELDKLLSEYGGMYVFSMIYYLLRRNLLPLPKSSFMQKKIKYQSQRFNIEDWQELYFLTLKADFAIKDGSLPEKVALTKLTQEFLNHLR